MLVKSWLQQVSSGKTPASLRRARRRKSVTRNSALRWLRPFVILMISIAWSTSIFGDQRRQHHHPLDSSKGNSSRISIQLVNVTVCNQKALAYFAELALRDDKPNIIAVTESHLKGTYLNKVRRQLRTIGWKSFVTPAYAPCRR